MVGSFTVYTPFTTYRHPGLTPATDPWAEPVQTTRTMAALPRGYANHSPRTAIAGYNNHAPLT